MVALSFCPQGSVGSSGCWPCSSSRPPIGPLLVPRHHQGVMKDTSSEFANIPMFLIVQARPSYFSRRMDHAWPCSATVFSQLGPHSGISWSYVMVSALSHSRLRTVTPYGDGLRWVGHFLRGSRIKAQLILSRATFIHFFCFSLILLALPATAPVCYYDVHHTFLFTPLILYPLPLPFHSQCCQGPASRSVRFIALSCRILSDLILTVRRRYLHG